MNKNLKNFLIVVGIFVLIDLATAPLRGGYLTIFGVTGIPLSSLVGFVVNFVVMQLLLIKLRDKNRSGIILLGAVVGVLLLSLPLHIMYFEPTLGTLLDTMIRLLAVVLAFVCCRFKVPVNAVLSVLALALGFYLSIYGNEAWITKYHSCAKSSEVVVNQTNCDIE